MQKGVLIGAILSALSVAPAAVVASDGAMPKIGMALTMVATDDRASSGTMVANGQELRLANTTADGYVLIEAVSMADGAALAAEISAMGGRNIRAHGKIVSAEFPPSALADLSASKMLAYATPTFSETRVGLVTSQGDASMLTDEVRDAAGLTGEGVTIGILSDSFSCVFAEGNTPQIYTSTEDDIASGDLPADFNGETDILLDFQGTGCIDEGRGMAQLIHDVVPDAKILYHTAFGGQPTFADGIIALSDAGADVIVDDVINLLEPMFQDGIIAQAADEVARRGIPYYSSNGNNGREAFDSEFRPVVANLDGEDATWHDFDPGPGVDLLQSITLEGFQTRKSFQWSEPYFSVSGGTGAQSSLEVILFDELGNQIADCFPNGGFVFPANGICQFTFTDGGVPIDGQIGGDPIDFISFVNFLPGPAVVSQAIKVEEGRNPEFVKWVNFGDAITFNELQTEGFSAYGHSNAAGAEGVGAAAFYFTERFIGDPNTLPLRELAGEEPCRPACLNNFSSAGGTPIYFDTEGNALPEPDIRFKPGITGPDGGNTTFFRFDTSRDDDNGDGSFTGPGEFPNFFGTSASAPHVAAVAVMMVEAEGSQILTTNRRGETRYLMCQPDDDDDSSSEDNGIRDDGDTRRVREDRVQNRLDRGWVLGPCSRSEAQDFYDAKRSTALDMSIRADNGSGATIAVFDEIGPDGFDFDSGFGFIDAPAAIEAFLDDDDDSDSDSDDDDSSDDD